MAALSITAARNTLSKIMDRVERGKERISLSRRGKVIAAVVPIEDFELLKRIAAEEDARDIREADRVAREFDRTQNAVTLEKFEKGL